MVRSRIPARERTVLHDATMPSSEKPIVPFLDETTAAKGLLAQDDVLPDLLRWQHDGLQAALVTLVAIEGAGPRPLGAQMAVAEDGRYAGYLSGGCLESAVALEALHALRTRTSRLVRFGRGSDYFDIELPCGTAIELYIDVDVAGAAGNAIARHLADRRPFAVASDLAGGPSVVAEIEATNTASARQGKMFTRVHMPALRLFLAGAGPAVGAIARLAHAAGLAPDVLTPDDHQIHALTTLGIAVQPLTRPELPARMSIDPWTAAVIAFHQHDWEPPIAMRLLQSPAFYVAALGSRTADARRRARLAELGLPASALDRLRPHLGSIPTAKSQATLAAGVLAEILAEARARGLVA